MNVDFYDFGIGADPHGRSPDAHAGGDDGIHVSFLFETVGIVPHQPHENVSREELAVVGVAA